MNNVKTLFLMSLLSAILVAIGWFIGGYGGMIVFLVIAGVMNFASFWFSDKLVLKMSGAKEVSQDEEPRLHALVEDVVSLTGMPKPKVCVINNDTPNAFATGRSPKNAAVAVTTGIMRILDYQELKAVIAHELGHIRNRDTLIQTVVATVAGAITMIAWMLQWSLLFGGGRRDGRDNPLAIIGLIATVLLAPIAASIIRFAISRSREFEADATGARMIHDPEALASALLKLHQGVQARPLEESKAGAQAMAHLYIVNPFKGQGMVNLFSTHPPIEERVRRLRAMAGLA